jgi:hypothetical protein
MPFDKSLLPVSKSAKIRASQQTLKIPKKPLFNQPQRTMETFKFMQSRLSKLNLVGKQLHEDKLAEIIRSTTEVLGCPPQVVRPLLQSFNKCFIDKKTQDLICWQVAGNRKRIFDSIPLLYTGKPEELGWMAGVIAEYLSDESQKFTQGVYRIKIMDGPAAGADMYMPAPKSLRLMSDVIGGTYRIDSDRFHLSDYKQAVLMQVLVYPEPMPIFKIEHNSGALKITVDSRVNSVEAIRATATQKKANLNLVSERNKLCQYGFGHPCHMCKVGYDECHRGCAPKTLTSLDVNKVTLLIKGNNICQTRSLEEV